MVITLLLILFLRLRVPRARNKKNTMYTCGLGLVHDLILVCVPPPQVTGTSMPMAFFLRQGVEMVDQGDHPPSMLMALCTAHVGPTPVMARTRREREADRAKEGASGRKDVIWSQRIYSILLGVNYNHVINRLFIYFT